MPGTGRGRPGIKKHYDSPNRKIDPAKVQELASLGVCPADIAKHQGVDHSAVWQYLDRHKIERKQVERYKADRADLFAFTGGRITGINHAVMASIEEDIENGILASLDPKVKGQLARDLSVVQGVYFDKERLERGQSTQNVSLIGKMMGSALDSAHKEAKPAQIEGEKLGS